MEVEINNWIMAGVIGVFILVWAGTSVYNHEEPAFSFLNKSVYGVFYTECIYESEEKTTHLNSTDEFQEFVARDYVGQARMDSEGNVNYTKLNKLCGRKKK